ncbi:hypothetical protein [Nonomuraea solani]|uniref:hypothetical protein n=1 Tax=Nonomuraea solani TaxID=1144553 RepID=UPI000CDECCEF|nr:hypothetical protein [Nonomuraea solani]
MLFGRADVVTGWAWAWAVFGMARVRNRGGPPVTSRPVFTRRGPVGYSPGPVGHGQRWLG